MKFLPEEQIIATPFQGITLTNYRVRSEGLEAMTSIMLDEVSHVRATWHANTGLLLLAFLAALAGGLIGIAMLSAPPLSRVDRNRCDCNRTCDRRYLYRLVLRLTTLLDNTRHSLITISSSGGVIRIQTNAKFAVCTEFLMKIEAAKHARANVLYSL